MTEDKKNKTGAFASVLFFSEVIKRIEESELLKRIEAMDLRFTEETEPEIKMKIRLGDSPQEITNNIAKLKKIASGKQVYLITGDFFFNIKIA